MRKGILRLSCSCAAILLFSGCGRDAPAEASAQRQFIKAFEPYCGKAYPATVVEDNAPSPAWDHPIVVHIRDCESSVVRVPLHVGPDRSRTWVITQGKDFIDLQHVHVHEDGSPDTVSPYGGRSADSGTPNQQSFPVDDASKALFVANGLDVSTTNVWSIRFTGADTMEYELTRPGRVFRITVDLTQPVEIPPPAWGANATSDLSGLQDLSVASTG